jgi:NAD(P)-dependent dehydrogenase (short-subunit alcohol dehydrogenase family)
MIDGPILITGASGRVGRVLVDHFLRAGGLVIGTARTRESVQALESQHAAHGKSLVVLRGDLTDPTCVKAIALELGRRGLLPSAVINNARSLESLAVGENDRVSRENFLNEYLLDVVVPYELTMELALQSGSCLRSVVNIGSQYGVVATNPSLYPDAQKGSPIHYGVAKAAVIHLTRELAVRLAARRIRVNCVSFGGINGRVDADFQARYSSLCPQGRMLEDADISGPVAFLASNASSGMTGHNLIVDGGWTAW